MVMHNHRFLVNAHELADFGGAFLFLKVEGGLHTHDQHFDADGC